MLKRGDKSPEVTQWQQFLTTQGYELVPSGIFDDSTVSATKDFQKSQNLFPDGLVGTDTITVAKKYLHSLGNIDVTGVSPKSKTFLYIGIAILALFALGKKWKT